MWLLRLKFFLLHQPLKLPLLLPRNRKPKKRNQILLPRNRKPKKRNQFSAAPAAAAHRDLEKGNEKEMGSNLDGLLPK
jgi:hypothetical protein